MTIVSVKTPGTYFYETTMGTITCLSFTAQGYLFACSCPVTSVSSCSSCIPSFRSVMLAKQSQFSAVSIDQLKCLQVLTVEAHFLQGQLYFPQFMAGFRFHNKACCSSSLRCLMLVSMPSCLSFRTCSQPPIDFVG